MLEAAVLGIPHDTLGEDVAAAVALRPGAEQQPDELRRFAKRARGAVQVPAHHHLPGHTAQGPSGKILKREIAVPR
ncbi:hypothetical protein ABZ614_42910 [Streptomyces sp. NPDC013178]|uniref:AMP-binding enzyme n=1 Tax=Streptomyces sp. NPDC013178 TaxID=3155118 RepID=UPI0033F2DA36